MAADQILAVIAQFTVSMLSSAGFWLYVSGKKEKRTCQTDLLIGLAHDRIVYLGLSYIDRGYITHEEYENLIEFLYKPYVKLGGNGSAKRILTLVEQLPIKHQGDLTPTKKGEIDNVFK